jgi:hypothetical protein
VAGCPRLFAGLILYAACKRSGQRTGLVHTAESAPIQCAEHVSAFATPVFSLTRQERRNPFKSNAFFNLQESRMANGAHCNFKRNRTIRACRGYRRSIEYRSQKPEKIV